MKKILGILLCALIVAIPVYADNTNGNGSTSGNSTTSGNTEAGSTNTNSETAQEARELRIQIKTNLQTLAQLRTQLKAEIQTKQQLMLQYKEQEQLTEEQRTEVKEMIANMSQVQTKLGSAYSNAVKALRAYKNDSSTDKITGLNSVIDSQEERISLLQDAISDLQ